MVINGIIKVYCILAIAGWTINNLSNFCVYLMEIGYFTIKRKLKRNRLKRKYRRKIPLNDDYIMISSAPPEEEEEPLEGNEMTPNSYS